MMHRVIGDPILIPMKKLCTETRKLHKGNDIRVRGLFEFFTPQFTESSI